MNVKVKKFNEALVNGGSNYDSLKGSNYMCTPGASGLLKRRNWAVALFCFGYMGAPYLGRETVP